ncbi:uncharacterized protein PHALS_07379 [Plasmopara halstedii]|uniref:Uncharacterized protein n=1 Tax=Plasmopara halstedii TaxID=4781 RepID=A0A0P1B6D6_PLAHL|nr:uncharacterized protein PHALS_07379 [Plasmopara halstedii]CEG49626.1 hypothetical protein PHALS_07379 [Plasmopara halstedii]|eukprot:XP_024585995.1 hypothetical protein PHALS_07379 [Plasmopara halstedii]
MPPAEEKLGGDDHGVPPEDGACSPSRDTDATAERGLLELRIDDCGIDEQRRAPWDRQ